jgi:hypothetical protein
MESTKKEFNVRGSMKRSPQGKGAPRKGSQEEYIEIIQRKGRQKSKLTNILCPKTEIQSSAQQKLARIR